MKKLRLIDKPLHDTFTVTVTDPPANGGASHHYTIEPGEPCLPTHIRFQKGIVNEAGVNGVSDESLLAIIIDRAEGFASGLFASADGVEALDHMKKALDCLERRFLDRQKRGVEGYEKT